MTKIVLIYTLDYVVESVVNYNRLLWSLQYVWQCVSYHNNMICDNIIYILRAQDKDFLVIHAQHSWTLLRIWLQHFMLSTCIRKSIFKTAVWWPLYLLLGVWWFVIVSNYLEDILLWYTCSQYNHVCTDEVLGRTGYDTPKISQECVAITVLPKDFTNDIQISLTIFSKNNFLPWFLYNCFFQHIPLTDIFQNSMYQVPLMGHWPLTDC